MQIREKMSELGNIWTQLREKLWNIEKKNFFSQKNQLFSTINDISYCF
jgi:hypothetical protein